MTLSKLPSMLAEAVGLHQKSQFAAAQSLYRRVLGLDPRQFDALHLLGVIERQLGNPARAVDLITQAIVVNPDQANAHCNLGAALQDLGQPEKALQSYERAVQLDPRYALAFSNRGNALRHLGRLDEALQSYQHALSLKPNYPEALCNRAIALNDAGRSEEARGSAEQAINARPNYADAWQAHANALHSLGRIVEALNSFNRAIAINADSGELHCSRGTALHRLKQYDAALDSYASAMELRPDHPLAYQYRGNTLRALGRNDEAIDAYRKALALGGDKPQIEFALAALGEGSTPAASPSSYVKALFDQYAGHFDQHLVDLLGYRTPAIIHAAIARQHVANADTLDLGCGTGLCGPFLRAVSHRLTGVDLSEKMLEKARARALYDALAVADIADYLNDKAGQYDLIVAADVFVYVGDLSAIFTSAHKALRPQGCFCFSVEQGERDFALTSANRYTHSLDYIRRLAGGFDIVEAGQHTLRTERDEEVGGYVVMLKKT